MKRFFTAALACLALWSPVFAQAPRLAVAFFHNAGPARDAWLAAGIEDALIADLGQLPGFKVAGRRERKLAAERLAAAAHGASSQEDALKLGKALGAQAVIWGEYRPVGDGLAVTAELLSVADGTALAEAELERSRAGVNTLEDEILIRLLSGVDAGRAGRLKFPALTGAEIRGVQARTLGAYEFEYRARALALEEPVPQEFLDVEEAVFRNLNRERVKARLSPFAYIQKLAFLGRHHSRNMAEHKFFDFTDPEGLDSEGRRQKLAPELLGSVGQVIAYNYGGSAEEVAGKLVRQWLASASRAEILNPDYRAVGVGVFRSEAGGFRFFCTVVPADLWAELVNPPPAAAAFASELELRFRFAGAFPKREMNVIVRYPDKTARMRKPDGSASVGFGFYAPRKWDGDFFTVTVSCDKGRGAYLVQAARGDLFLPAGLAFSVE